MATDRSSLVQIAQRVRRLNNGHLEGTVPQSAYLNAIGSVQRQLDTIGADWDDLDRIIASSI